MAYENIILEVEKSIAKITFNRPKALNALNQALLDELDKALDEVEQNEDVKVLVLTGAGDKAFVAGADITEINKLNALEAKFFCKKGHDVMARLQEIPIPVIAAVNGFALGGGSEMALSCDFIYASETAKFGLPEITLGIIPGFGGTQKLPRLIGKNLAKEMIFTGKMLSAAEAKDVGLVNQVVPLEELMDSVMKVASSIAKKGRVSLRAAKYAVNTGMDVDLATGCKIEIDSFALCMDSPDAKEGTSAFMEKRKAEFKGSIKG
ncbi:MAG: enoyl-CoA hydratase-related protein [Desulforegulaceae bacterium]|nr:enoyl-CoA hydratase-related protein [Desulforegulaceae bacterium]